MILKQKYDSFTQRLAAFYCTALAPKKEHISIPETSDSAFTQLHSFFSELYNVLYKTPKTLVPNDKEDVYLKKGEHRSKNQTFKKAEGAVKPIIVDFIDFLYNAGQTGELKGTSFIIDKIIFDKYISNKKREKLLFLEGLTAIGFQVTISDNWVILLNNKYPDMFQAMQIFSRKCAQNTHKQGRFCFFICDYNAMDTKYEINAAEFIGRIISCDNEYGFLLDIHNYLIQNGYSISYKFESEVAIEIFYTNRKIKSTPLLGIEFDIRYDEPVHVNIRFVSTSRLTQISGTLSPEMQEAFYNDTWQCRGADCGWCKNQKGLLHPSKLTVKDKQKIICWFAQKSFSKVKENELDTIFKYIKFHEKLII